MSRKSYTMREMKDIVKYIVSNNGYAETKGRLLWQNYAATTKTNRTWQSLKETFLKRILTDIANPYYELTQEQINSFRSGSNINIRLLNKLEWHTCDSEAGPSNEIKNRLSDKHEKQQDAGDEVAVPTLEQGELADSQISKDVREDSNSRDTLHLYSNDEGNQSENEDDAKSDKTLVVTEDDQKKKANSSRESGRISKLKDKLIFLEPLTPMMQEMITDSDVSNSSDSVQDVIHDNQQIQEKDASSKEDKENETMGNINVIEKDESNKKSLNSKTEKVEHDRKKKIVDLSNSETTSKIDDSKSQNSDKAVLKSKLISNEMKDSASVGVLSTCETQASETTETVKDNFESRNVENNDGHVKEIQKNCIEHEIKSSTKLVNYQSKLTPKNKESDKAIVDVNEVITVQTSTRLESIHTKGSETKNANNGAKISSLSLKGSSMYLKSSSDSLHSSDDAEASNSARAVCKAERSKSKGLAKVFGFVSGERNLKFVTSKKYRMNQSSKTKSRNSDRNSLSALSSWNSNSSDSESNSEYVSRRNYQQMIQPLEVKAHIKNGMLMAICGDQMYPVIKQVGSKRHYVKWKDDESSKMTVAKKWKRGKNNHKYITTTGDRENNNCSTNLSSSSVSDSDGKSFRKIRRYTTKKMESKCRYQGETCSTPSDQWRNEFLLEKQKNEKLMRLLDQLKNQKSCEENCQAPRNVNESQSTNQDVQIDLSEDEKKTTNQDNVLKISASYGDKVIQMEIKDDDLTNPLQKVLQALRCNSKNETDEMLEDQQAIRESEEVQARVDKLEETIFNTIVELDKHEELVAEEKVVENNKTEVNLPPEISPVVNVIDENGNTNVENATTDSPKRLFRKRKSEDRNTVETRKHKNSPRNRKKDTLNLPASNNEVTTISIPTTEESQIAAITAPTAQDNHVPATPKAHKKKKNSRKQRELSESKVEDNNLSKSISKEESNVDKETSIEQSQVTKSTPQMTSGNDLPLDDSDQEIVFAKESLDKRSSVEVRSSGRTKKNSNRKQDTPANVTPEESAKILRETPRLRSEDHKERTKVPNGSIYPTRSQNKLKNKKKATHILQQELSSISNARFTSPESAHGYVDSDLSPVLQSSFNKPKCKRKYKLIKKKPIILNLLPRSIRRLRQSNEFKKQIDISKLPSHTTQKAMNTSIKSASYHTTPISKVKAKNKRVLENIPIIYINQSPLSQLIESNSISTTEAVASSDVDKHSNFENTPNSMGNLTPKGQDMSRYSELAVSPEISFIEKIPVNLDMLNPGSDDLACNTDHLPIKTLIDESHSSLNQDVSVRESREQEKKQDDNIDDDNLTPRGQYTPRYSESPDISFIEKITVSLKMLNREGNDSLCSLDRLPTKTLVETHSLLDENVSVNESKDNQRKNDDSNVHNSQLSEQSSLQESRGYVSLVSESLISGISNVNLSNKLQLSETLETEFTNLSLEKQQNKVDLDSGILKEKKVTKKDKSKMKSSSKSTRKSNSTPSKETEDIFDAVGYNSNDENILHDSKRRRGKKTICKS